MYLTVQRRIENIVKHLRWNFHTHDYKKKTPPFNFRIMKPNCKGTLMQI